MEDPRLPWIALGLMIMTVWLLVQAYQTCDDCHGVSMTTKRRKGCPQNRWRNRSDARLCDICFARRKRWGK
jgi:hypothetical protein